LKIVPCGLSSQCDQLTLCRPQLHWGAASFSDFSSSDERVETPNLPVTTLDDFLDAHLQLRPVRYIKCDVQSHEAAVMKGASRVLSEDRPEILMEWGDWDCARREELFGLFQEMDYRAYRLQHGRLEGLIPPSVQAGQQLGTTTCFCPPKLCQQWVEENCSF
jgi:hypothetical protein